MGSKYPPESQKAFYAGMRYFADIMGIDNTGSNQELFERLTRYRKNQDHPVKNQPRFRKKNCMFCYRRPNLTISISRDGEIDEVALPTRKESMNYVLNFEFCDVCGNGMHCGAVFYRIQPKSSKSPISIEHATPRKNDGINRLCFICFSELFEIKTALRLVGEIGKAVQDEFDYSKHFKDALMRFYNNIYEENSIYALIEIYTLREFRVPLYKLIIEEIEKLEEEAMLDDMYDGHHKDHQFAEDPIQCDFCWFDEYRGRFEIFINFEDNFDLESFKVYPIQEKSYLKYLLD
ncbi:MAG: hypothetical protein HeimC2_42440 [Candidatus Heimdallarchaeota archaeon LC_2]|nr:MAG: hypothetical protein HeimC2_42440 [Candidatus Heimdallarchaeota archaeon LC_2]